MRHPLIAALEEAETSWMMGDFVDQRNGLRVADRAIEELATRPNPMERFLLSLEALRALRDRQRERGQMEMAREIDRNVRQLEARAARLGVMN